MLKRIYADNYRCLVNFEWRPAPRQLLIGANGSAKTSLFDLLRLLSGLVGWGDALNDPALVPFVGPGSRTRWQDIAEQTFEIDVAGNGGLYTLRLKIDQSDPKVGPLVVHEEVEFSGTPLFLRSRDQFGQIDDRTDQWVGMSYRFPGKTSAIGSGEFREGSRMDWLKRWLMKLLVVAPDPRRMAADSRQEAWRLDHDLANFADWYREVLLSENPREYLADLAEVFPDFDRLHLATRGSQSRELVASFFQTEGKDRPLVLGSERKGGKPIEYSFDELSDGQRVLIALYAVLHFALRPGATVCIDEPDNFVALREVEPWLAKVFDRTGEEDEPQVLIASHHPEFLNRMGFREGALLQRTDGRHTRVERFTDPDRTGLTPAELVARGWET